MVFKNNDVIKNKIYHKRDLKLLFIMVIIFSLFYIVAFFVIRQPTVKKSEYKYLVKCDPTKLREYVDFLCNQVPPRNHKHEEGLEKTRNFIYEVFSKYGNEVLVDEWSEEKNTFKNISLNFEQSQKKSIIIGAHYDVWSNLPGADDNASGVAGLLELARMFSEVQPKVNIELVAFDAEEPTYFGSKLMGSYIHSKKIKESKKEVIGMVCLGMIGYYSKTQPMSYIFMNILYPRKGNFIAVVGRWEDRKMAKKFKQGINGTKRIKCVSYSGPKIIGVDLSDHSSYWNEGFNAVMITDTAFLRNPNYHTKNDLPETLNYEKMATVIDGVFNTVMNYEN